MVTAAELPKGLTYIKDSSPGIYRKKKGKGFTYVDSDGNKISDEKQLQRIADLVIPPAWTEVWISPKKNSYLQVTGVDERDRKQYIYHEKWSEHAQKLKFEDLLNFGFYLPKLRKRYQRDLKDKSWGRKKVLALATALLDTLYLRVGSKHYTETNKTHGLTTLRRKHLSQEGNKLRIQFTGKSGKDRSLLLTDKRLIRLLTSCSELPGYELFRYQEDGKWHSLDSSLLNDYISEEVETEDYFTAKYFRTWGANSLCVKFKDKSVELCEGTRKKPETMLVKLVAEELGHTQAVCKSSYLHPDILNHCINTSSLEDCLPKDFDPKDYKPEEYEMIQILCSIVH